MLLTDGILNRFRVINEELHLPHGTKSARVIIHTDLDGIISGILMVNQLVKQGIPKERIDIQYAQYGDDEKQKEDKGAHAFQPRKKGDWVGTVDFAKYPKGKPWEIYNKMMDFKGSKKQLVDLMNARDWRQSKGLDVFTNFIKKVLNPKENKFLDKSIKDLYAIFKAYSSWGKKENPVSIDNIEKYSIQLVKPDFGSDHHSNEDGSLSAAKRGDVAAESPSEAEFFADKYASGLMGASDLKAVSAIDSADYREEELKNTIFLEKHFTGPSRKKNLAMIISALYDNLVKKDERVGKWIVLNSQPSLVSLYNTTIKGLKFNGERLRLIEALKNGDMKTGQEIAAALPKILKKNWTDTTGPNYVDRNGKMISKANDLEAWRKKGQKDLEDAKTGYAGKGDQKRLEEIKGKRDKESKAIRDEIKAKKGKLSQAKNFTIFDGKSPKTQYGRYMGALYSENGVRNPYLMRVWNGMFQISLNTIYKSALVKAGIKEGIVDFSEIGKHVVDDVCAFLKSKGISSFSIEKIREKMTEKNGGHKGGIWTFSGFDEIKPPSKELGGETYYKDKEKAYKAAEIEGRRTGTKITGMPKVIDAARKYIKNTADRLDNVQNTTVKKYDEIRKEAQDVAMRSAINWTNKLYPPRQEGLEALKNNDARFERS